MGRVLQCTPRVSMGIVAALAATLMLAAPASAATTRYATPTGSPAATCTELDPCALSTAITMSANTDTVQLVGGSAATFTLSTQLSVPTGVTLQGTAGARPTIAAGSLDNALAAEAPGSVLRDVRVLGSGSGGAYMVEAASGGTLERVSATASGTMPPCYAQSGGTIRGSTCQYTGVSGTSALRVERNTGTGDVPPVTLSNVTAVSPGAGISVYLATPNAGDLPVHGTNVIALSTNGGADIFATRGTVTTATATVTMDHSNYDSFEPQEGTSITPAGASGGQTDPPLLMNVAGGDLRQAATSSSTIDQGAATADPFDFEGDPRSSGAAPDIGADEAIATSAPGISPRPVAGDTAVRGTTTEADGTSVEVSIAGVLAGSTTAAGGTWNVPNLSPLLAGQVVSAIAQAPGKPRSTATTTTVLPRADSPQGVIPLPVPPKRCKKGKKLKRGKCVKKKRKKKKKK